MSYSASILFVSGRAEADASKLLIDSCSRKSRAPVRVVNPIGGQAEQSCALRSRASDALDCPSCASTSARETGFYQNDSARPDSLQERKRAQDCTASASSARALRIGPAKNEIKRWQ